MIILRVILVHFFSFVKMKCPFNLFHTKIYSPFLAVNKHMKRFIQIKFPRPKKSQLLTISPLLNESTNVESSVRSTYPAFWTSLRNLSSFDCCSRVKLPKCLRKIILINSIRYYPGAWSGFVDIEGRLR
jgi:hypothetical protein